MKPGSTSLAKAARPASALSAGPKQRPGAIASARRSRAGQPAAAQPRPAPASTCAGVSCSKACGREGSGPGTASAISPRRFATTTSMCVGALAPSLGSMRVREIRRLDIQEFVDELLGGGPGASTVNNILNPIQAFYRRAPTAKNSPTTRRAHRIPNAASRSPEANRLARRSGRADRSSRGERPIWATAFYAGLRRGSCRHCAAATPTSRSPDHR